MRKQKLLTNHEESRDDSNSKNPNASALYRLTEDETNLIKEEMTKRKIPDKFEIDILSAACNFKKINILKPENLDYLYQFPTVAEYTGGLFATLEGLKCLPENREIASKNAESIIATSQTLSYLDEAEILDKTLAATMCQTPNPMLLERLMRALHEAGHLNKKSVQLAHLFNNYTPITEQLVTKLISICTEFADTTVAIQTFIDREKLQSKENPEKKRKFDALVEAANDILEDTHLLKRNLRHPFWSSIKDTAFKEMDEEPTSSPR